MRKLIGSALVAGLLVALAPSSAAAPVSWTDPPDDATTAGATSNEPTLDIRSVTVTTAGNRLKWTQKLAKMADSNPPGSVGYFFVFTFAVNDVAYDIRVREDVSAKAATIRKVGTGNQDLPCKDCKYSIERKAGTVTADIAISSLAEAVKAGDASITVGPGTKLTGLSVGAFRSFAAVSLRADDSPAPEGTTFTL